ncbi:MAG: hypothetical protein FGF51_02370 [Candidatus Brockarchaeota archaeon]|nr:hypothetical protein [Candidatus Brockarchaeota archaeon]
MIVQAVRLYESTHPLRLVANKYEAHTTEYGSTAVFQRCLPRLQQQSGEWVNDEHNPVLVPAER